MIITFTDSIIPAECSGERDLYFDEREVLRTFIFEDQCGNISVGCTQQIIYTFDECQGLTSPGNVGILGSNLLIIPPGCNVPHIEVLSDEIGVCGYVEYMWLMSTQEDQNGNLFIPTIFNIGSLWTMIPNANEATYDPGVLSVNTYYVRCARNFSCCDYLESNIVGYRTSQDAACPSVVEIISDCNSSIVLQSPTDDVQNDQNMRYETNQKIEANINVAINAQLILNARAGIDLQPGFKIDTSSLLEVSIKGCED